MCSQYSSAPCPPPGAFVTPLEQNMKGRRELTWYISSFKMSVIVLCHLSLLHWANLFEFHTPPVEDLRNHSNRGSENFKQINLFGTSEHNIYPLCDESNIKIPQSGVHLKIHTPQVIHFSKIFYRGCMDFKWSSPLSATCKTQGLLPYFT